MRRPIRRRGWQAAILGCIAIAASLACTRSPGETAPPAARMPGTLQITVFGLSRHGLAIAVETPSGALYFVDTGDKLGDSDTGKDTLAPFLRARGVDAIDGIVISHPHHDHFEGAAYLLKHFEVATFVDAGAEGALVDTEYLDLRKRAQKRAKGYRVVHAGDTLPWDPALEVTVLAPPIGGVRSSDDDRLNDNSVVLRIQHGDNVFLLPGDLEHEGSESLLATVPAETLRSTVLVAPHHGFFDEARFVDAVHPRTVVVSCLANYTNKKPRSPGDLAKRVFGAVGAEVYVTAEHGSVTVTSDGVRCAVRSQQEPR